MTGRVCSVPECGRLLHQRGRLTDDAVRSIRARAGSQSAASLAREFGVGEAAITAVIKRKTWVHVKDDTPGRIAAVLEEAA